jgi:hypothetical protein
MYQGFIVMISSSRWGVGHTFVDTSASRVLSHEFDGTLESRARGREVQERTCQAQEIDVNVDIDNVWKALPWDKFVEVGGH